MAEHAAKLRALLCRWIEPSELANGLGPRIGKAVQQARVSRPFRQR
jgi:hypothetical protein